MIETDSTLLPNPAKTEKHRKYNASDKGKARRARWNHSQKGLISKAKFDASPKRQESRYQEYKKGLRDRIAVKQEKIHELERELHVQEVTG